MYRKTRVHEEILSIDLCLKPLFIYIKFKIIYNGLIGDFLDVYKNKGDSHLFYYVKDT